ncbi:hypothetical protein C8R43DRAFT_1132251 [Mycena crocata]|nr:hypothetical protein C8R43DRAFT_1132251 [Mycena crocata]
MTAQRMKVPPAGSNCRILPPKANAPLRVKHRIHISLNNASTSCPPDEISSVPFWIHIFPPTREPLSSGGICDSTTYRNPEGGLKIPIFFAAGGKNPAPTFKASFPSKHWCSLYIAVSRRAAAAEAITRRFEIREQGFRPVSPPEANTALTFNIPTLSDFLPPEATTAKTFNTLFAGPPMCRVHWATAT